MPNQFFIFIFKSSKIPILPNKAVTLCLTPNLALKFNKLINMRSSTSETCSRNDIVVVRREIFHTQLKNIKLQRALRASNQECCRQLVLQKWKIISFLST